MSKVHYLRRGEMSGGKIIFINRFFYPDISATSQILSEMSFALAARGRKIVIITSRQRYDAPEKRLAPREVIGNIDIYRVWTSHFGRHALLGRAVDYLTFYLSSAWLLLGIVRPDDIVVSKTDPPLLGVVIGPIARLRGARRVNWLQDIFPETAEILGVGGAALRPLFWALRVVRNHSLRSADSNVVIGELMAGKLTSYGVPENRLRTIPNWADGSNIKPRAREANGLRDAWGINNSFVVGYSGNLGRAHEIDALVDAICYLEKEKLSNHQSRLEICWLFIGGGAPLNLLMEKVQRLELKTVKFQPYQPRALLAESLSVADVHLVSLRSELEGLIVPSKIYGIAAAGRPAIFIGAEDGEVARILRRYDFGVRVGADGAELAEAVRSLALDMDRARILGRNARSAFEESFDLSHGVKSWSALFDALSPSTAARSEVDLAE